MELTFQSSGDGFKVRLFPMVYMHTLFLLYYRLSSDTGLAVFRHASGQAQFHVPQGKTKANSPDVCFSCCGCQLASSK